MIDRDTWITANEMIKLYGNDAAIRELESAEPVGR